MVRCARCGADRFILPRSPLPAPEATKAGSDAGPGQRQSRLWIYPTAAVVFTLLILGVVYLGFQAFHSGPATRDTDKKGTSEESGAKERLRQARENLAQGKFRLAVQALLSDESPGAELTPAERRAWRQLYREAAVLADLNYEQVDEVLSHAAGMPEAEWRADFRQRYQGKALVFDVLLSRKPGGGLQANHPFFAGPDQARLELSEKPFGSMNLDQPRRVIFGARLASVRLEPPGPTWVVRFLPDSEVLLTDRQGAGRYCPPLADPESAKILEEQARLVRDEVK